MRNSEQLPKFVRCWIRNKTNIPINLALHIIVRGTHQFFVHLQFGTYLMTCLLNPGAYRHKKLRLSSAPLGLVMKKSAIYFFCQSNLDQCNLDTWITIIFWLCLGKISFSYLLKIKFTYLKIKFENASVYEHMLLFEINYIIVITVVKMDQNHKSLSKILYAQLKILTFSNQV